MRITGGQARGRRLGSLKGLSIRPTSDRVREAIFDLLGQDTTGFNVLDLFAGSGSLGLEALSRGALWALFIDGSPRSVSVVKKNLMLCGYASSGVVLKRDLTRNLPWKSLLKGKRIDLVFLDPPYGKDLIPPLLKQLSESEILASSSTLIAESFKTDKLPGTVGQLEMIDVRTYGETRIHIYRNEEEQ